MQYTKIFDLCKWMRYIPNIFERMIGWTIFITKDYATN